MIGRRGARRRRGRVVFAALDFATRLAGRYRHRRSEGRAGGAVTDAELVWLRPFAWLRRLRRPIAAAAGVIAAPAPTGVTAPAATPVAMPVRDGRGFAAPTMRTTIIHAL